MRKQSNNNNMAAVILAAGLSSRMKENKLLMPWNGVSIIEWVVSRLLEARIKQIIVVTGREKEKIEALTNFPEVDHIFNENFADGEMLHSLQCGLEGLSNNIHAALVVLGDQPQVEVKTILNVVDAYNIETDSKLVLPSFQNKRGHPWIVARELWQEILEMKPPDNLRLFMNRHSADIHYVPVETDSILSDIDTQQDYRNSVKTRSGN